MDERLLLEVRGRLGPRWNERRAAQVRASIERRLHRRRVYVGACAVAATVLVGALFGLLPKHSAPAGHPTELARALPAAPPSFALAEPRAKQEEPTATPLTADTELVVDPQGGGRGFVLRHGAARFVVAHDEKHPFRVQAGALTIEDLGTVFSVHRTSDAQFEVGVEEGKVAVSCRQDRWELQAGDRRTLTCSDPSSRPATEIRPATAPKPAGRARAVASAGSEAGWRKLAERGRYVEAYESLQTSLQNGTAASVRDEIADLLLAADTARLSGHSGDAVPYLERILTSHADDPRAEVTAFTLGRVWLEELARPENAARAFERARTRGTPLAEDALARAVEAWARAGDTQHAHELALEYERLYPRGRRARVVAKFGGLE